MAAGLARLGYSGSSERSDATTSVSIAKLMATVYIIAAAMGSCGGRCLRTIHGARMMQIVGLILARTYHVDLPCEHTMWTSKWQCIFARE